MYYKGCNSKNDHEIFILKAEFDRMKSLEEERKQSPKLQMKDFCDRMAFKGIIISIAMAWFQQTTGLFIFATYASLIFEISDSILSVDASAIVLATINILGGFVSTQMGDAFGRKTTMISSLIGATIGLLTFSTYLYLNHHQYDVSHYNWLPVVCLSSVMFISSLGILALANTCVVENFSPKVIFHKCFFLRFCF